MRCCNYCDVTSVHSLNLRNLPGRFSYGPGTRLSLPSSHKAGPATKSAVATRRIIGQVVRARIMKITIGRKNILIDEVSTSNGILVVEEGQQQCLSDVGACTLTDSSIFRHAKVACGLAGLSWLSRYNSGTIIT